MIDSDDLLHRVDQHYLGPTGFTLPVRIRYAALGLGAAFMVTVFVVARAVVHVPLGFKSLVVMIVITIALTARVTKFVNADRPVRSVIRAAWNDLNAPAHRSPARPSRSAFPPFPAPPAARMPSRRPKVSPPDDCAARQRDRRTVRSELRRARADHRCARCVAAVVGGGNGSEPSRPHPAPGAEPEPTAQGTRRGKKRGGRSDPEAEFTRQAAAAKNRADRERKAMRLALVGVEGNVTRTRRRGSCSRRGRGTCVRSANSAATSRTRPWSWRTSPNPV